MDRTLRAALVELVGTFFLVFFTASITLFTFKAYAPDHPEPRIGLVGVAVGQGCLLAVLLTASCLLSDGCLNPAVTLMLWVTRRFEGRRALLLLTLQLIGSALAGGLLTLVFHSDPGLMSRGHLGAPFLKMGRTPDEPIPFLGLLSGMAVEGGLSFLLTLTLFITIFDPRRPNLGGLGAGLAQTVCVLAGFLLTGACVNPACWFGPALWYASLPGVLHPFADHTVYWVGPILGAMLAAVVYSTLFQPADSKEKAAWKP